MHVIIVSSGVLTGVCHYCVVWSADRCMAYMLIVGFGVRRSLVCVLFVFLCLLTTYYLCSHCLIWQSYKIILCDCLV